MQRRGTPKRLRDLQTPCLVLDDVRMKRNVQRLRSRLANANVTFRPHLKTAKSIDVARLLMETASGPATVSTLAEAEYFAAAGVKDILYAVGIAPNKLDRLLAIRRGGVDVSIILDSLEQADLVAAKSREAGGPIPTLIEIDCDGHRAGVKPDSKILLEIGKRLHLNGASLRGVLTHAGGSYDCRTSECIVQAAENERDAAVSAADALRRAGLPAPIVSIGSTPTAHFSGDLTGVTEIRAGVFVFFDLVMAGLGVCTLDDIAISVLSTVIGHQKEKGWTLVDAGWMALSRDRGTAKQRLDQGYGLICDSEGRVVEDYLVIEANQEHGIMASRTPGKALPELPVGQLIRILPNHACATGAQHDRYHLLAGDSDEVVAIWPRLRGW
jgi:D-serine deaminase-like pyridoxal phosphate-dependent protein